MKRKMRLSQRVVVEPLSRQRVRTRVFEKMLPNGATITIILKQKVVFVEGTKNGIDCFSVKMTRKPGWRDRFEYLVSKAIGRNRYDKETQARLPSPEES